MSLNAYPHLPKRGTSAQWTSANVVLGVGEVGFETDTRREKRGDGETAWRDLPYHDGATDVIAPPGWDTAWETARTAGKAHIAIFGDSTDTGENSTNMMLNNWPELLREHLVSKYGAWADFYPAWTYCEWVNNAMVGHDGNSPPFNMTASPQVYEGGYGRVLSIPANQQAYFVSPHPCIAMDIIWLDYAPGTWTYTVDGGPVQSVTANGPNAVQGTHVRKTSITGLALGVHTIHMGPTADNIGMLIGVTCYYSDNQGIGIARNAYNGMRIVDLATKVGYNTGAGGNLSMPEDKISLWQGTRWAPVGPITPTGFGFPTQPDLAVISYGINEVNTGASLLAFRQALVRLVSALRRGKSGCSIIFMAKAFPSDVNSDAGVGGGFMVYPKFKEEMAALARTYNAAFVDIDSRWGLTPVADGRMSFNNIHPTDTGYMDIFSVIGGLL